MDCFSLLVSANYSEDQIICFSYEIFLPITL